MKKSLVIFLVIFISSVLNSGCENPLEDFQLSFKDPIQRGLLTIKLQSYANTIPENIEISLLGADKEKIVNTLNVPKFELNDEGIITFAVSPDLKPSAGQPVTYTVVFTAEGYTSVYQPVSFTTDGNQNKSLRMAKLSGNPSEVDAAQAKYTSAALSVEQTLSTGVTTVTSVKVGTAFSTADGTPLTGDLTVTMHTVGNGKKYFLPGGGLVANAYTPDLQKLGEAFEFKQLIQYTYFQVTDTEGNLAHLLSKPITQRIRVPSSLKKLDANRNVQAGDKLTVVSYDELSNRWIKEKGAVVGSDANGLFIELSISHLSYWAVGWERPLCSFGPKYVVKSNFQDVDINYLAQIKDVTTGAVVREVYLSVNNGQSYNYNYFPSEGNTFRMEVQNFSNFRGGDRQVIVTSGTTAGCTTDTHVLDLSSLTLPKPIQVKFKVNCPAGKELDESLLPSEMRTQISEPGKNNWQNLLTFTRQTREIKTYRLTPESTYDFRISTDGGASWPYKQINYKIEKASWSIEIDAANYCK